MQPPPALKEYDSRETLESLTRYVDLVHKWNPKINLVARSQIGELWNRHIWDSVQLWPHIQNSTQHIDLGSGGGLPGLVLAILAKTNESIMKTSLVESDIRKAVFLRTVTRELELDVSVHDKRFQFVPPANAQTLSARALASLSDLLSAAERHLSPSGCAVFPKGARWAEEVEEAKRTWAFHLETIASITDSQAALLKIKDIRRV